MDITHTLTHTLLLLACCCCGFTVRAEAEGEKCGEPVDATTAGYITSPGYPSEYPPHQNCEWVITAPEPTQRIILNFNPHFELERLDCRYDFIEIRDGSSDSADLLGRHCSNIAPPAIMSSGPVVHIKFVSDYAHQGAGFSLRYEILKTVLQRKRKKKKRKKKNDGCLFSDVGFQAKEFHECCSLQATRRVLQTCRLNRHIQSCFSRRMWE